MNNYIHINNYIYACKTLTKTLPEKKSLVTQLWIMCKIGTVQNHSVHKNNQHSEPSWAYLKEVIRELHRNTILKMFINTKSKRTSKYLHPWPSNFPFPQVCWHLLFYTYKTITCNCVSRNYRYHLSHYSIYFVYIPKCDDNSLLHLLLDACKMKP